MQQPLYRLRDEATDIASFALDDELLRQAEAASLAAKPHQSLSLSLTWQKSALLKSKPPNHLIRYLSQMICFDLSLMTQLLRQLLQQIHKQLPPQSLVLKRHRLQITQLNNSTSC